ncbi:(deoxy)nucleoside triphosphate pyrophosphohydrolase [Sutterella sp.]|uniref:(deoxy)nucleoside triphosphate pyrophosphohydrolase n=1 Tax=Sutterella sp. TaxID=1981025 RepID=UPI0026E0DFD8|nr:(deoxy)nucleoside triphosphate pyrophosphohydrolase [Sutterella sp.]MDO5531978.1 (deoxy)nucleoside triphosphate pyrophosphohydrolase [Sutterella sp.]
MKRVEVSAAMIHHEGRVLATQRGYGDFKDGWEFPGGKVEPGETPEAAIVREIREELGVEITPERLVTTVECDYPNFHLTMHCFLATIRSGKVELLEHEAARWLAPEELGDVAWLPADVEAVEKLKAILLPDGRTLS